METEFLIFMDLTNDVFTYRVALKQMLNLDHWTTGGLGTTRTTCHHVYWQALDIDIIEESKCECLIFEVSYVRRPLYRVKKELLCSNF